MKEVDLIKHVRLLDSPGVILETKGRLDNSEIALKNAIRVESLADPVAPVQAILRRCSRDNVSRYILLRKTRAVLFYPAFEIMEETVVTSLVNGKEIFTLLERD